MERRSASPATGARDTRAPTLDDLLSLQRPGGKARKRVAPAPSSPAVANEAEWLQVFNILLHITQASTHMDQTKPADGKEDERRAHDAFNYFDSNKDGVISKDEFNSLLIRLVPTQWNEESVAALFLAADLDQDSVINIHEFLSWVFGGSEGQTVLQAALHHEDTSRRELSARDFEELKRLLAPDDVARAVKGSRGRAGVEGQKFVGLLRSADFVSSGAGAGALNFRNFVLWQSGMLRRAERNIAARAQLLSDGVAALEAVETRITRLAAIFGSRHTSASLQRALEDARTVCSESELAPHQKRIEEMRLAEAITIPSLHKELDRARLMLESGAGSACSAAMLEFHLARLQELHMAEVADSKTCLSLEKALASARNVCASSILEPHQKRLWEMQLAEASNIISLENALELVGAVCSPAELAPHYARLRALHEVEVSKSNTVSLLAAALGKASSVCDPRVLVPHYNRLEEMQKAYQILLVSLSGEQHEADVRRLLSVAELSRTVAELFHKESYQIQLAFKGERLSPGTACLEDFGIIESGSQITVFFIGEAQYLQEERQRLMTDMNECLPFLVAAQNAIDILERKDFAEAKTPKPPGGCEEVGACIIHLLAGISVFIEVDRKGVPKDTGWTGFRKAAANVDTFMRGLAGFQDCINNHLVPQENVDRAREIIHSLGDDLSYLRKRLHLSYALAIWVTNIIKYYDAFQPLARDFRNIEQRLETLAQQAQ